MHYSHRVKFRMGSSEINILRSAVAKAKSHISETGVPFVQCIMLASLPPPFLRFYVTHFKYNRCFPHSSYPQESLNISLAVEGFGQEVEDLDFFTSACLAH